MLWKLNVCLYGLNDAPRRWFMKVVSVLSELGFIQSKIHPALFFVSVEDQLSGLLIVHVDDFLHAGDTKFVSTCLKSLRDKFTVGTTGQSCFRYTGVNVNVLDEAIQIDQLHYSNSLAPVSLPARRSSNKNDLLSASENKAYRAAVGSLNWICQQTRPDVSFDVLEFSLKLKSAAVEDLLRVNKCIKKVKLADVHLLFRKLDLKSARLVSWSDAAFANLSDKVSSGSGYVIMLVDGRNACCPLVWRSNKIKRVVKSTIAAEALVFDDALGHALYFQELFKEVLNSDIKILCVSDSDNLVKAIGSSHQVEDRRLRLDIASIKQAVCEKDIDVLHVPGKKMVANCLTKRGASSELLLNIMQSGMVPDGIFDDTESYLRLEGEEN